MGKVYLDQKFQPFFWSLFFALLSSSCSSGTPNATQPETSQRAQASGNVFDEYMNAEAAPADGFDFPFGNPDGKGSYIDRATGRNHNGWYVATRFAESYSLGIHPGEDWNGAGGGNTDLGQDVYAVANGQVVFAAHCGRLWGNVIIIEHTYYENHVKRKIRSLYAHLNEIKVQNGEKLQRRQIIATIGQDPEKLFNAHLHLEFRLDETLPPTYWPSSAGKDAGWVSNHYAPPAEFINNHRKLFVPHLESTLLLIDSAEYKMRYYQTGKQQGEYDVSFGQSKGQKRQQGDNKTPRGMYFVTYKHRGQFDGPYGKYYGGHWIKFNYPNKYDAEWGKGNNIITPEQALKSEQTGKNARPRSRAQDSVEASVFTAGSRSGRTMAHDTSRGAV